MVLMLQTVQNFSRRAPAEVEGILKTGVISPTQTSACMPDLDIKGTYVGSSSVAGNRPLYITTVQF